MVCYVAPVIGETVEVRIEVPRRGFIKRGTYSGRVVLVSPLPSPFNYGSVMGTLGEDGDPLDAIVLGPPRAMGESVRVRVRAVVRFVDRGLTDDKLVCSDGELDAFELARVEWFFRFYAFGKRWMSRVIGVRSPTRFAGVRE
jgi:inorganic pyrophosphatase